MSYIQSSAFKRDALGYAGNEIGHAWLGFNCVMLTFGVFSDHVYEAPNVGIIAMFTLAYLAIIEVPQLVAHKFNWRVLVDSLEDAAWFTVGVWAWFKAQPSLEMRQFIIELDIVLLIGMLIRYGYYRRHAEKATLRIEGADVVEVKAQVRIGEAEIKVKAED